MIQQAQQILQNQFGYEDFREGQQDVIEKLIDKQDVLAIMPTGGGKSLCYQIPALLFGGLTIIVSPLISLMKDQVDALLAEGVAATYINSTLNGQEIDARLEAAAAGEINMLYVAPERMETPSFRRLLEQTSISLMAVDEAHCISQWGHDFRPSYRVLSNVLAELQPKPPIIALTATATEDVARDICDQLGITYNNRVQTGFSRENLSFQVVKGQDKDKYLLDYLKKNYEQAGIIYASTRKEVERLTAILNKNGIAAGQYHGGMSDKARAEYQEQFLYDDITVIVATNAFGMGINKSNVRFVIHYNIPRNMEAYYQEAGRAGRDGLPSDCILLFAPQDAHIQQFLIDQSELSEEYKQNEYLKLRKMTGYGYTEICLQKYIVQYFGDEAPECKHCSNCLDTRERVDITIEAQQAFSCVKRMGERFGKAMVAKVLTGSQDKKVQSWRFHELSTYGLMKGVPQNEVLQLLDYLTAERYLLATDGQFPALQLSELAVEVLRGERAVLRKQARRAEKVRMNVDEELFDELRTVRRSLASEFQVPPYIIFSDDTLREMCLYLPKDEEALLDIKGVGEAKLEKYGTYFLEVLQNVEDKRED